MKPDRELVAAWLQDALLAVDPEPLTRLALDGWSGPLQVIAIGKAAPAMCRGAARAVGSISGLCVSNHPEMVPGGIELLVGDHPVPGPNSLIAGRRALDCAGSADIALISGGGSALCEVPADGVSMDFVAEATRALLDHGVDIEEANLLRAHLSSIKGGGLGTIPTFVLSDVCAHGPGVVSSGPTIPVEPDPDAALAILGALGVPVPTEVEDAVRNWRPASRSPEVRVIGDGRTAARGAAISAGGVVDPVTVRESWITGPLESALVEFLSSSADGVTIAAGEPLLQTAGSGVGGRNTHAALLAASHLAGTGAVFAALATDGVDGSSHAAGAIVDGTTLDRGGDPHQALADFDSATYLERSGDVIETGPTGTNVADLWLIWKPEGESEPILAP